MRSALVIYLRRAYIFNQEAMEYARHRRGNNKKPQQISEIYCHVNAAVREMYLLSLNQARRSGINELFEAIRKRA